MESIMTTTSTIKPFSAGLVSLGVSVTAKEIDAKLTLDNFHKRLKRHGVNAANIKDYEPEFGRIALAYQESKHTGFIAWLNGAGDMKGTVESPFKNGNGKLYTKRECEALVRALTWKRMDQYEKQLNGESKTSSKRTERSLFTQDVRALHPRLVAFQRLVEPTQYELDHLKLIRGVIEHAIAHDPQAKAEFNSLESKQAKATK
jgi:hypothetical protein